MHGLTVLQHDVVGDVNDIIDGTHAIRTQTLPQPLGRGADLDICDHTGGIAVAEVSSRNLHIQLVIHGPGIGATDYRLVVLHGQTKCGG